MRSSVSRTRRVAASGRGITVRGVRTAEEWLACADPERMLIGRALHDKLSARKCRLFACACCRSIWELLPDERSRSAVAVSERFADGLATREELSATWGAAQAVS